MKRRLIIIPLIVFCIGTVASRGEVADYIEKYAYEALPLTGHAEDREIVRMKIIHGKDGIEYQSLINSSKSSEEVRVKMDGEGTFISGTRRVESSDGKQKSEELIWREANRIFLEENEDGNKRTKSYDLADREMFAVDGSLLLLLRSFPFGSGESWTVFMVDFGGYTITVDASLAGRETITVPAGTFDCYRIEVVVGIPLLRPRLTYWLAKDKPHFLVKSTGKRGPLTDTYLTVLVRKQ